MWVLVLYVREAFAVFLERFVSGGKTDTPVSVGLHSRAVCREDMHVK